MKATYKRQWLILGACSIFAGFTIVAGRFLQIEYIKTLSIFTIYFLSGIVFANFFKIISTQTIVFFIPGVFFILFGYYDNWAAAVIWTTELVIIFFGFFSGYFSRTTKSLKKLYFIIPSFLVVILFSFYVNPRILLASEFKDLSQNKRIQNNEKIEFTLQRTDGTYVKNSDLKGKIILLDFWFIGCAPCYDKMKYLSKIADYYKNRNDIVIITADVEQEDKFEKFKTIIKKFPPNMLYVYDSAALLAKSLKLRGFPTEIIIDKAGKIRHQMVGFNKDIALVYKSYTIQSIDEINEKY